MLRKSDKEQKTIIDTLKKFLVNCFCENKKIKIDINKTIKLILDVLRISNSDRKIITEKIK